MKKTKFFLASFAAAIGLIFSSCGSTGTASKSVKNTVSLENQKIELKGVVNARQLGGYKTMDGRTIKQNLLLRSAALNNATDEDVRILSEKYKLKAVADFRTDAERNPALDREIPNCTNSHLNILGTLASGALSNDILAKLAKMDEVERYKFISKYMNIDSIYTQIVTTENSWKNYRKFFDILLNTENGAVLWHCTQGKDRAGFGTIFVLSALGVDEETIEKDFALSNDSYAPAIQKISERAKAENWSEAEYENTLGLVGVSVKSMKKAVALIKKENGSMENFLKNKIGLKADEIQKLRDKYLE